MKRDPLAEARNVSWMLHRLEARDQLAISPPDRPTVPPAELLDALATLASEMLESAEVLTESLHEAIDGGQITEDAWDHAHAAYSLAYETQPVISEIARRVASARTATSLEMKRRKGIA